MWIRMSLYCIRFQSNRYRPQRYRVLLGELDEVESLLYDDAGKGEEMAAALTRMSW